MTKFTLIVRPQVLDDIRQARNYYNTKSPGLGDRFRRTAIQTIDSLAKFPFYQIKHSKVVRTKNTPNFPFLVHFSLDEQSKELLVLAILHAASDPDSWVEVLTR